MNDKCPRCGTELEYDEVDIGVGTMKGNPGCPECHWTPSEESISEKVAYVKSQGQTRNHECHWPGCNEQVPPALWGCRKHWYSLPAYLRTKVWAAYKIGQEVKMNPSEHYIKVMHEVEEWIKLHYKGV